MVLFVAAVAIVAPSTRWLTSPAALAGSASRGPAQVTSGGLGIQLGDVTPDPAADPRSQVYITNRIAPGTTLFRRISLTNGTAEPAHVSLYPAAATIAGGQFRFADGRSPNELSSWTAVSPSAVTLTAGASTSAAVTIAVPVTATAGERYGVVWAEVGTGSPGVGIQEINRVGVRMYVSIGPGPAPADGFSIGPLTPAPGSLQPAVLTAQVRNTGGRALDVGGELRLAAITGKATEGPFPVEGATIGVGQVATVTATVTAAPTGVREATLVLRSGLTEQSATTRLTFPLGATTPPPAGGPSPLAWIIGVIVVIAAALGFGLRRVGGRDRARGKEGS